MILTKMSVDSTLRGMVLLTVHTHGPYYTNSSYLPCMCAQPIELNNWPRTDDALIPLIH